MITPMTKYSLIMLSGDESRILESIQSLGIIDIRRSSKPVDAHSSALLAESEELRKRIADISGDRYARDEQFVRISSELDQTRKTRKEVEVWGPFEAEKISGLGRLGLKMRFYCVADNKFKEEWSELQPLEIVERGDGKVWFVTVGPAEDYSFPVPECKGPQVSVDNCDAKIKSLEKELGQCITRLDGEKALLPALKEKLESNLNSLELYLAGVSAEKAAEDKLCILTGFAPTADDASISAKLDAEEGLYWTSEVATKEDNPPIKLKNNWFARQFESLTGMYGMPVYDEWDATPILAPFYLLFFSMCMGDAGYGLLLIAIAYAFKGIKGDGPMGLAKFWRLIRTLGIGTFVVGIFLGTFFGIDLSAASWVPDWLKGIMLTGNVGTFPLQMVLALGIGVVHICLAMVVKSLLYTQRFGFKETISSWGWTLLIVGSLIVLSVGALLKLPAEVLKWIVIGIAAVSVLGIFIFNKPGRNPLINIGAGLWDTYQMATGLLGDVLSYIRLYALGLAGGMLGSAFNTLGGLVLGDHPTFQWIFFIVIVLLGHALNLAMSCLGAFVHPLRLTFVEYFKNSGYVGKGVEYRPLKINKQ